jgi:hypothetical protein
MVLEISFIFVGTGWCDCLCKLSLNHVIVPSRRHPLTLVLYLCCFSCEKCYSLCICIIACTVSFEFCHCFYHASFDLYEFNPVLYIAGLVLSTEGATNGDVLGVSFFPSSQRKKKKN